MTRTINTNSISSTSTMTLPAIKTVPVQTPMFTRVGGTAKRLLSTLMRSLATPHI